MIDPTLILRAMAQNQQVQPLTVSEIEQRQLHLADLRTQGKMHSLELTQAQQHMSDQEALRQIFRTTPDPEAALKKVYGVSPQLGISMQKSISEQRKASIDLMTATIDNRLKQADEVSRILGSISDDNTLQLGIKAAVDRGYMKPEAAAQISHMTFADPQVQSFLKQKTMEALSAKEQLEQQRSAAEEHRKATEFEHKEEDRPDTKRKLGAEASKAQYDSQTAGLGVAARTVPDNQDEYSQWRAGLSPELQAKVPAMFSPAAAQIVQRMGMTPSENAATMDRRVTAAETGRHNLASEAETARGHSLSAGATVDAARITAGQHVFTNANSLRDDLRKDTSNFGIVANSYGQIQAAKIGGPISDIALMYAYMKMLDPNSVVREGEYATAQNAGGVPAQIQNMYNNLVGGGKLTGDIKTQIVGQAEKVYQQSKKDSDKVSDQYRGIAVRNGIDPQDIFIDKSSTAAAPPAAPTGAQKTMSMHDVRATAAASGKSVDEVIRAAKAKGYVVQ